MSAETITEARDTDTLHVDCPLCGEHVLIDVEIEFTRYADGSTATRATGDANDHDCHPTEALTLRSTP